MDASPSADASHECLDRHLLKIADTGLTKFGDVGIYGPSMIHVRVQLPRDVACRHCVFQWKYTAANSWGTDPSTGETGPGLGRENETFMGCSDIAILPNGAPTDPPQVIIPTKYLIFDHRLINKHLIPIFRPTTAAPTPSTSSTPQWSSGSQSPQTWWPQSSTTGEWPQTWWPQPSRDPTAPTITTTSTTARPSLGLTTWDPDLFDYQIGDEVMYDGVKYRCIFPNRSVGSAPPGPLTWALWKPIED